MLLLSSISLITNKFHPRGMNFLHLIFELWKPQLYFIILLCQTILLGGLQLQPQHPSMHSFKQRGPKQCK